MKRLFPKLTWMFFIFVLTAADAENRLSEIYESGRKRFIEELADIPTADPEVAISLYKGLRSEFALGPEKKELRSALAAELLKNPSVMLFLEDRLDTIPQSFIHGQGRGYLFDVLGDLRTVSSVELLGKHLMDDTVLSDPGLTKEEILDHIGHRGGSGSSNQSYAAWALARLELKDAPTDRPIGLAHQRGAVEKWRPWWEANKNDIAATLVVEGEQEPPAPEELNQSLGTDSKNIRKEIVPSKGDGQALEESSRWNTVFVWFSCGLILLAALYYIMLKVKEPKS